MGGSKLKIAVILIGVLLISAIAAFGAAVYIMGQKDMIFPGVRVGGTELGGLTRQEALTKIKEYEKALADKTISVTYQGGGGAFRLHETGFRLAAEDMVAKAYVKGRRGSWLTQWRERQQLAGTLGDIPLAYTADKKKLHQALDEITKAVRVPPRDAVLAVNPDDTVQIIESTDGYGVDLEAAWDWLTKEAVAGSEMSLKLVPVRPARTTEDVRAMGVNGLVTQFTTRFDLRKTNRVFNIKVAAEALDGLEIKPGQEFSFNKIVGPRSQEAGYKLAPAILNNEFVDSLGGGVCQVSTTLYNTILLADLQLVERSSHSLVVSYVPLGQDAAVAYGGKDLRFKNNYDTYLLIKSQLVGNSITFKLYGDQKNKKEVRIVNTVINDYPYETVTKQDTALAAGKQTVKQKGVKGYKVVSQKLVYSGGRLLKKEKLPASFYNPQDHIILTGPGGAAASSAPRKGVNNPPKPVPPGGSNSAAPNDPASEPETQPEIPTADSNGIHGEPYAPVEPNNPVPPPPVNEVSPPVSGSPAGQ